MRTHHRRPGDDAQTPHATGALQSRLTDHQIRAIYRFMYQRVGNREDAERLTEHACVETLRAAHDLPDEQSLEETLWRTARAMVAEHLRWFYDAPAATSEDIPGAEEAEQANATVWARDILAQLPQHERDFLTLRFLGADSLADAAAALHMAVGDARALQWFALLDAARAMQPEKSCCA
jgi:RNA polymerase sigma-70 factor, ECF subfamily